MEENLVDQHLKSLMAQLGHAINQELSASESIAEVIEDIRREGYDVYLVLEGTIGFTKRDEKEGDMSGDYSFSEADRAFLQALKINPSEED